MSSSPGAARGAEPLLAMPPPEPNAALPGLELPLAGPDAALPAGRVLQLDGLRALAFLSVLANHMTHLPLLWAGVDVFFVLSGFLITGILLERKHLGGPYFSYFYRRRVFRIVPPFLLTVGVYGLVFGWNSFHPLWLFFLAPNVQSLRPHTPYLTMWSLAVEEQFYFVWPFVVLLTSEKILMRLAVAALVLTPVLRMVCTPLFPNHFYIYCLTPFRADLLCAGAVLALLRKRGNPKTMAAIQRGAPWLCLAGFFLFAGTQAFPAFRLARNTPLANGFVYLFSLLGATGLLAWALTGTGWLRRALTLQPLRYLGEISYTTYLIHVPVLVWFHVHFGGDTPQAQAESVAFILLYSSVSWFALERPLLRFAARRPMKLQPVRRSGVALGDHA